jgi:hypothetical protein
MSMDGAEHLRRFLADRRSRNDHTAVPGLTPFDLIEARGLIHGLVAAGTVEQEAAEAVLADAAAAAQSDLGRELDARHAPPEGFASAVQATANAGTTLVRVVPAALVDASVITALSTDVWTTMVSVRFGYPEGADGAQIIRAEQPCTAVDDLGASYTETSRVTCDAGGIVISTRVLRPAPSPLAQALTIALDGTAAVTVPLH